MTAPSGARLPRRIAMLPSVPIAWSKSAMISVRLISFPISADMLAPFAHYKDLLDCGIEDLKKLFERLLTIGEYDSLVVEMGALSESLMDFMVCADRLFVVDRRDGFGDVRKKVFLHYCEMEKKNDLLALAEFIPLWKSFSSPVPSFSRSPPWKTLINGIFPPVSCQAACRFLLPTCPLP